MKAGEQNLSNAMIPRGRAAVALLMAMPILAVGALFTFGGNPYSGVAGAAPKANKVVVLGGSGGQPKPACPKKCQVVASVTGIQVEAAGRQVPFRVPFDGRITGWKIFLGKPNDRDRRLLNAKWGSPPQAAIAVLKKRSSGGQEKFELKRRSPTVSLGGKLGKAPYFKLAKPLRVVKGDQVGLSVPTWIPAFKSGLSRSRNAWRASRRPKKCNPANESVTAQLNVGSIRPYGCRYAGARLLYQVRVQAR